MLKHSVLSCSNRLKLESHLFNCLLFFVLSTSPSLMVAFSSNPVVWDVSYSSPALSKKTLHLACALHILHFGEKKNVKRYRATFELGGAPPSVISGLESEPVTMILGEEPVAISWEVHCIDCCYTVFFFICWFTCIIWGEI